MVSRRDAVSIASSARCKDKLEVQLAFTRPDPDPRRTPSEKSFSKSPSEPSPSFEPKSEKPSGRPLTPPSSLPYASVARPRASNDAPSRPFAKTTSSSLARSASASESVRGETASMTSAVGAKR